ncbi:response regulator transcription factor [Inhella sp. 1Y17]|uniref:Response regulator transcription factor n=1 Tax=Inhella proteolytica TaxID=2795029 RepID=A0A931NDJ5_9BURK|nr:response regulator transcription factor [Inhella proteolytica]
MRTLIVEDSRLAREGLVRMLGAFPELELVGQAADLEQALALTRTLQPELLFLDIQLPGGSGFELLAQLDEAPRVIFTTAYAEHAIRSFDHRTVDYLLKPIAPERLAQAVARLGEPGGAAVRPPLERDSRIFIKDGERCHLVSLAEIRCIESCKNYVRVHWGSQQAYVKRSLNAVEERLPRGQFFRANRQMLVNLKAVREIREALGEGYLLSLDDGQRIELSRRNAAELKALLSL